MIRRLAACAAVLASIATSAPAYEPTTGYETREVEGWTLKVHKGFLKDRPSLAGRTLKLMGQQLDQITRVVPPEALAKLRKVRIWVEEDEPHHPCATYHPNVDWLREHGMNPDKARCVEVSNARAFLDWTRQQPWMILHELTHAYLDQFTPGGFGNPALRDAYDKAIADGLYDRVLLFDGRTVKGYAATNPMEYFSELSEAYFGVNDMYPFVRAELREHDPGGAAVVRSLWGVPGDDSAKPRRASGRWPVGGRRVKMATRTDPVARPETRPTP